MQRICLCFEVSKKVVVVFNASSFDLKIRFGGHCKTSTNSAKVLEAILILFENCVVLYCFLYVLCN